MVPSLGPNGGAVPLPVLTLVVDDPMDGTAEEDDVKPMEVNPEVLPSVLITARASVPGRCTGNVHVICNY